MEKIDFANPIDTKILFEKSGATDDENCRKKEKGTHRERKIKPELQGRHTIPINVQVRILFGRE